MALAILLISLPIPKKGELTTRSNSAVSTGSARASLASSWLLMSVLAQARINCIAACGGDGNSDGLIARIFFCTCMLLPGSDGQTSPAIVACKNYRYSLFGFPI